MRRLSYSNVVATMALLLAVCGGAVYAADKIGSGQIRRSAVRSRHIAQGAVRTKDLHRDAATGAKIAEATLGIVPTATSATSVGGVSIEPVSVALADDTGQGSVPVTISGSAVALSCEAGVARIQVKRGASGPPITGEWVRQGVNPVVAHPLPSTSTVVQGDALEASATIREGSGRVTRISVDAFYEANAYGGPEDCFFQGTIERFG